MRFMLAAACIAVGTSASAASLSGMDVETLFGTYNGASAGDYMGGPDIEGALYVGGNLSGSNINIGDRLTGPLSTPALVVKGNSTASFKIGVTSENYISGNQNGNVERFAGAQGNCASAQTCVYVGGSFVGLDNFGIIETGANAQAEIAANSPTIDFAGLISYSDYLASLTSETINTSDPNQIRIDTINNAVQSEGTDWDASKVSVYNVDLADLSTGTLLSDIAPGDGETIIINVSGTSGTYGLNTNIANDAGQQIFWNFFQATGTVNFNSKIVGSILAPQASLSGFSGNVEGSVFGDTISQSNGEFHYQPFVGDLPTMPAVPLPAGLPLLAGALAGFALLRRMRST